MLIFLTPTPFFLTFEKSNSMGIVNSFVNQIGRETGRDAYKSIISTNKFRSKVSSVEAPLSLLQDVKSFELTANDEATLLKITNLVEKSENSDPEDFEWQELFRELDNKIDFCKENLNKEFHPKLEILDQLNADNFQKVKKEHIDYIKRVINVLEEDNVQNSEEKTLLLLNFFRLLA